MHCINTFRPARSLGVLALFLGLYARGWGSYAQELTQTITLRPGWNAVWVEVDPTNREPAVVFAGLPLTGVWTWSERVSATDFIQNPEVTGWNRARWLAYFAPDSPQAPLANLYAVLPRRAYLLKLESTSNVVWSVTGRPSVLSDPWSPDRYNLRGLPADPNHPPTFTDFFRWSTAHFDSATSKLQPIYRLAASGEWNLVNPTDLVQRGEAYWVYTQGASAYVAPFSLETTAGDGLDFGASVKRCDVWVHNVSGLNLPVSVTSVKGNAVGLSILNPAISTNPPIPLAGYLHQSSAQRTAHFSVQLNRTAPFATRGNLLAVADGQGSLFYLSEIGQLGLGTGQSSAFSGLWAGTVTITNVSAVGGTNNVLTNAAPVPLGFPLRVLMHVDTNGLTTLLREVTLLYDHANGVPLTNTDLVGSAQLSRLITDPALLAGLQPSDLRSGRITARRLSAPHFDFRPPVGRFEVPLTGEFAISNQVSGTLNIPADLPSNPFLHRYHPDHGTNRAYAITRQVTFVLAPPTTAGNSGSGTALGGTFSEVITGLHKLPLFASGQLDLHQVSNTGVLNASAQ